VRVQRAFAFVDLAGFSNLTAREGDERAVTLLGEFRALLREICSRRGVRIAKWLGDGAMLVGVEAEWLVAAILELQHAVGDRSMPVHLTCGITCGAVILLEGDDYIGHAVNVASRLCDLAEPPQVLATTAVVRHLPPWGSVTASADVQLRGIDDPMTIVHLGLRQVGPEAEPDPVCGIGLTPETAVHVRHDGVGRTVLLCSGSCLETWEGRPGPAPEESGSFRIPFMGG
jgi:adenylate cyclase